MSKLEEITCPCGEKFEAELWNAINAVEDPELKEALISGEINVVCCPACGEIFYAEHFLLYHDSRNEIIAFVYPSSFQHQATYWAEKMRRDFETAVAELMPEERVDYEPVLLFGLDSLADLLRAEDEEGDEVTILEHVASDLKLKLINLKPSLARPMRMPRVIPCCGGAKSDDMREEIMDGLRKLLKHNTNLEAYRKLLDSIERNKNWKLDKKLLKK